ncbi:zinc finger and SCAN domain-containing protein 2-like [Anopheles cruzii]|uniref:zinc finger and SCAN domain-containing protein 2-like n=1 Tax=Anopheles cruzii TaxID=68878 RepID=UPI0022EC870C|nr:zinc finger and SCAN domain-containing protein 2-like [Anopheles cruzii]
MSTDEEMEPLAYDESGDYLLQKIFECTSVQVMPLAGFPSNLCTICESRLDDLYLFRWQCIKNDELINRFSAELNKPSIPPEDHATQRTIDTETVTGKDEDVRRSVEKDEIIETNPSTNETTDGDDLDGSSDYELLEVKLEEDDDQSYIVVLEPRSPSPDEELDLQQRTIGTVPVETAPKNRPKVNPSIHSVVHDRLCPYCPATFRTASRLMFHINTHTGKKPYVCKVCNKAFHSANNRKVHMKLHDKDQHHQCPHCSSKFAQFHQLEVHIRTHTGEKPYVCPQQQHRSLQQ